MQISAVINRKADMVQRVKGKRRRRRIKNWQPDLRFTRRGGRRPNAGAPRKAGSGVSHARRAKLSSSYPVQITLKLRAGLPSMRRKAAYHAILDAFYAGRDRFGFRLNQYTVQSNHLHMIVEATDRTALSRGMQGLTIRIAKALNRTWARKGKVFNDRYHDHILRTPTEVRNSIRYVLCNHERHGHSITGRPDPYASALWFDGWKNYKPSFAADFDPPTIPARTRLQRERWRRLGLIPVPSTRPRPRSAS